LAPEEQVIQYGCIGLEVIDAEAEAALEESINNNNSIFTPDTDPLRAHAGDTVRYGENLHTLIVVGKPR
jgi:hypothetical protein